MFVARNAAEGWGPSTNPEESGLQSKQRSDSETSARASGDLIAGRYRLTSIIAQGGMGTIWKARNEATGFDVAVKVPNAIAGGGAAESTSQFLFEATTAATLCHSAIVRILDFGLAEDDQPFIAMDLLEGLSLREVLRRTGGLQAIELCASMKRSRLP